MIIFISILYLLAQLILLTGFIKLMRGGKIAPAESGISLITAAKNEKGTLEGFINAIKDIDYPGDRFEVIFADDNSTDGTFETAVKASQSIKNFKVINAGAKSLPGKRGALQRGIEKSNYLYIMITDADCLPSAGWLKAASGLFMKGYDFIVGPAPLKRIKSNFISSLSCMENLKNHFLSFSIASLGLPYTAAARNMGFSRQAFSKMGGYNRTIDTAGGDDDLLLREAVRNNLRIKYFYDEYAMVFSRTPLFLIEYLDQKARHTQTSLHYLPIHKIVLGCWHFLNLFMILSPILLIINIHFIWIFILRMLTAMLIFSTIQKKFRYDFTPLEIFRFDLISEIFVLVNFFNAVFRKTKWK